MVECLVRMYGVEMTSASPEISWFAIPVVRRSKSFGQVRYMKTHAQFGAVHENLKILCHASKTEHC
jgi:hypothetical protein